jgi:dTDP-4-amino-4,6-dideoxygalactose transaminase
VIVPSFTFFATAEAVLALGGVPVFVDVDEYYCLNVDQVAASVTSKTRAVIPVHLFGQPADMGPLLELAQARNVRIIEDNAQAFGSTYRGRKTGGLGDIGCLSFFPSKNLGAYGDGGMVLTNDPAIAERVRMLRMHGWKRKYHPETVGYNSRLDELQAAILRVKLKYVDGWNAARRERAARYDRLFAGTHVIAPGLRPGAEHVFHLYVVEVEARDDVRKALAEKQVASDVYYPVPLHLVEPCIDYGRSPGSLPRSEAASRKALAIPLFPELSDGEQDFVVDAVLNATAAIAASAKR